MLRRWEGVDLILRSGKALDGRMAYAKVNFRNSDCVLVFSIQGPEYGSTIAWDR